VDGRWYALVVLGFTAAALNTGANLLLALAGVGLGLVVGNGIFARRALKRLRVQLNGPGQVAQGSRLRLGVEVWGGRRGSPLAWVADADWADRPLGALGVPPHSRVRLSLEPAEPLRRGQHTLGALRLTCDAPFGLVEARVFPSASHTVLVTPAVFPLRSGALEVRARGDGVAVSNWLQGAEQRDRVRTLREFRAGDSPRAIHWRSSARRGSLVVREFERGVPERACVVVQVAPGDPELIDAGLSLAASLCAALRARGERVGLAVIGARSVWVPPEAPAERALEALALAEPAAGPVELGPEVRRVGGDLATRLWLITHAPEVKLGGATRWVLRVPADADRWLRRQSAPSPEQVGVEGAA